MTPRKVCHPDTRVVHTLVHRACDSRGDVHRLKLDRIPAKSRGGRHEVLSLASMLFAFDTCWERENWFPPMVCQPHSRVGGLYALE